MRYCCSFVGPLARLPSAPPPALPERAEASCLALHADEVSLSAVCRLQTPPVPARTVQTRAPSPALVSAICRAASIQRAGTPSFEPASIAGRRRINAAGRCGFSGRLAPAAPRHRQPLRAALFLRLKPCVSRNHASSLALLLLRDQQQTQQRDRPVADRPPRHGKKEQAPPAFQPRRPSLQQASPHCSRRRKRCVFRLCHPVHGNQQAKPVTRLCRRYSCFLHRTCCHDRAYRRRLESPAESPRRPLYTQRQ